MKKVILGFLLLIAAVAQGQNVQLMYDFGSQKEHLTATFEHFSVDEYGTNFYFIDAEFNGANDGVSLAYIKAMRTIKLFKSPFSVHLGFDGGLLHTDVFSAHINNSYMLGGDYTYMSKDYSKTVSFKAMHKTIHGIDNSTFQLSTIWVLNYLSNKITASGFIHYWQEKSTNIVYSEPQFWYNATKYVSLGGEVKLGYNFNNSGLVFTPSVGIKCNL